jgi:Cys-Gly metallodipeptidase DUG1
VPPQTPEKIILLVNAYLESEFAELNSKNKMQVEHLQGGKPWVASVSPWNFESAKKAIEVGLKRFLPCGELESA